MSKNYAELLKAIDDGDRDLINKNLSSLNPSSDSSQNMYSNDPSENIYLAMIQRAINNDDDYALNFIIDHYHKHGLRAHQIYPLIKLALVHDGMKTAQELADFYPFGWLLSYWKGEDPQKLENEITSFENGFIETFNRILDSKETDIYGGKGIISPKSQTEKLNFLIKFFQNSIKYWSRWYKFFADAEYDTYLPESGRHVILLDSLKKIFSYPNVADYFLNNEDVIEFFQSPTIFNFVVEKIPESLVPLLKNVPISQEVDTRHIERYARDLVEKRCKMGSDWVTIDKIYQNLDTGDIEPMLFESSDPRLEAIDYFNKHYYYFMGDEIEKYKNNASIMNYIETSHPRKFSSHPNLSELEFANFLELLLLAKIISSECENLDGRAEALEDIEKSYFDILGLDGMIDYHLKACLKASYEITFSEKKKIIERIWEKDFKNENIYKYMNDKEFMCSLISISLFCRDLRNNFTASDMAVILKTILKDQNMLSIYNKISEENPQNLIGFEKSKQKICQTLEKIMFENFKRKSKMSSQSSAKRQRFQ